MITENIQPLISFIIPTYNSAKYLRRSLESCFNQTYPNIEVILIDDGSSDNTIDVVSEFANLINFRYFKNEQNEGIIYSLNRGISLARGEYIVRMDADDISLPRRIEEQVEFLLKNPSIDILGTDVVFIDQNDRKFGRPREFLSCEAEIEWSMISSCPLHHPTVMFQKKYLYLKEDQFVEDLGLWARAILSGKKIVVLDQALLLYRKHPTSVTVIHGNSQIKASVSISSRYASEKWNLKISNDFLYSIRTRNKFADKSFFIEASHIIQSLKQTGNHKIARAAAIDIQIMSLACIHSYFRNNESNKLQAIYNCLLFIFSPENFKTIPKAFLKFYHGLARRLIT